MKHLGKSIMAAVAAAAMGLASPASVAAQENYPAETIHMVVPWAAGGGTDTIARALAAAMEEETGATIVVDNISGASGATGSLDVARARPDGYKILLNGSSDMTAALTFQDLPFSLDDYAFAGSVYTTPTWVVSHADRGYDDLGELIAAAKEKPGELTIGVGGAVGAHALMAHAIKGHGELDVRIVPYQGGAALNKAVLANEVDAGVIHSPILLNEVREGLVNVLAAGGPLDRISHEPLRGMKTLKDHGIPVEVGVTRGIFLPAGTPPEIVEKLGEMIRSAVESESFAEFGKRFGFTPTWRDGEEFEALLRDELKTFSEIREKFISQ